MDFGIAGRRAAIGGASSGLGLGTARALVAEGVHVAICGRSAEKLDAVAAELGELCTPIVADLSTPGGATGFVESAIDQLGGIDILVPNAGGPPPGNFASTDVDAYSSALDLSLVSVVAMCKAAVPAMQERGWGRVAAITSVSVRQPIAELILSNTARAGTTGFLKTLAREVAADGVTVNSVQPGLHATPRVTQLYSDGIPDGMRLGDPDDFGAVVAFLCSQQAAFTTGAHLNVDGGSYAGLL